MSLQVVAHAKRGGSVQLRVRADRRWHRTDNKAESVKKHFFALVELECKTYLMEPN